MLKGDILISNNHPTFPFVQNTASQIFLIALMFRIVGIIITSTTDLNPDEGGDVRAFAIEANLYATSELTFFDFMTSVGSTVPTWGFFISPFWYLPGPSMLYTRLAIALAGSYAVYNIYLIIQHKTSNQAAIVATLPLAILPSFVALHSVILREAAILCGLVVIIRMFSGPSKLDWRQRYVVVVSIGVFISMLRLDNLPIYLIMVGTGYLVWRTSIKNAIIVGGLSVPFAIISYPILKRSLRFLDLLRGRPGIFDYLVWLRGARVREGGRTQYLIDVSLQTPLEVFQFGPVGALYFLFAPFPWMIENHLDYFIVIESIIMMVFAFYGVKGVVILGKRNFPLTIGLLVGFVLFLFFYGIISVNVGTSVRQRQTFSWVIFALGGIGIAEHYRFKLNWSFRVFGSSDANPP